MNLIKILFCSFLSVMSVNAFAQEDEFLSGNITDPEYVYSLHLYDKGLKELPDNFSELTELETLILDDNELSQLPASITSLQKLTDISLPRNQFTSFPKEILELKNLKNLDLNDNPIKIIPHEISSLSQLQYLLISETGIKEVPESICKLKNLEMLFVSNNQLKTLPSCFKDLTKLEYLYISENSFESFPNIITELVNLKTLGIAQKNQLEIPAGIKNLKNLESIFLDDDYYKKNKSKIDKILPKDCEVNPAPPPPPSLPSLEPIEYVDTPQINEVIANEYCFNLTEKIKKGEMVTETLYTLEFGDIYDHARLTKETSEYNEKKQLEAEKEGYTIVHLSTADYSFGKYVINNGQVTYVPESGEKKTFKIKYEKDGKTIHELTDSKKQIWKKGNCFAPPPSVGF